MASANGEMASGACGGTAARSASQGTEAPPGDAGMVSQASGACGGTAARSDTGSGGVGGGDSAPATVAHPPPALQRVGGGGDGGGDGGDDDEFAMLEEAEIKHMTVAKLKDALRSRQLSTGGRKGALCQRLLEACGHAEPTLAAPVRPAVQPPAAKKRRVLHAKYMQVVGGTDEDTTERSLPIAEPTDSAACG